MKLTIVNKMVKLLLPAEIETFYVIPTLRKHLAIAMREKGMKVDDVARLLMVNKAAISQYTNHKRGSKVDFGEKVLIEIKRLAPEIKDHLSYLQVMQELLQFVRSREHLCKIHKQFSVVPNECHPDVVGCHRQKASCSKVCGKKNGSC